MTSDSRRARGPAEHGVERLDLRDFLAQNLRKAADVLTSAAQRLARAAPSPEAALDRYVVSMPSAQNAIGILQGWNCALPPEAGVTCGQGAFYADPRITWAMEQAGGIAGKRVLELGPLEASHTYMLEQGEPTLLCAIEANKLAFLRCLVVKEVLDLKIARFLLGNFTEWLEKSGEHYDLVVASGVLYHMQDPLRLLELIAARTDAFYLWTHYVSLEAMPEDDPRRGAFVGEPELHEYRGFPVRLYKRSYHGAWKNKSYCGGAHDLHRWIEKDDLLAVIRALGFSDVRIAHDAPGHMFGPSFSIFARREEATPTRQAPPAAV